MNQQAGDILDILADPNLPACRLRSYSCTHGGGDRREGGVPKPSSFRTARFRKAGSGGGCAGRSPQSGADAIADGKPRLVSVQPPDVLDNQGHEAGEEEGGVRFAKHMCPSQDAMDIFVEPILLRPQIVICGSSPVARRSGQAFGVRRHVLRAGSRVAGFRRC